MTRDTLSDLIAFALFAGALYLGQDAFDRGDGGFVVISALTLSFGFLALRSATGPGTGPIDN